MMRTLLVLCALAYALTVQANDFIDRNAKNVDLHTVEDYWRWMHEQSLSLKPLAVIRRNASEHKNDVVSKKGTYGLLYSFISQDSGVAVMSGLFVVAPGQSASKYMRGFIAGNFRAMEEQGGVFREIPCADKYADECYTYVMEFPDEPVAGNLIALRNGQKIYWVELTGAGGFSTADEIRRFMDKKASNALRFSPNSTSLGAAR